MSDMTENVSVGINAGQVAVDDIEGAQELVSTHILSALGSLKSRGATHAKIKLTFKYSTKS
jgi:hypothetical protein